MMFNHDYSVNDPDLNPMYETQGRAGQRFNDTQYGGFEIGLKYNVLSTCKNIVGPKFQLSSRHWSTTAGVLWQVSGAGSPFSCSRNGRNYDEHERIHIGLAVGYELD